MCSSFNKICNVKYGHNKLYKNLQQTGFHYNDMDQT